VRSYRSCPSRILAFLCKDQSRKALRRPSRAATRAARACLVLLASVPGLCHRARRIRIPSGLRVMCSDPSRRCSQPPVNSQWHDSLRIAAAKRWVCKALNSVSAVS